MSDREGLTAGLVFAVGTIAAVAVATKTRRFRAATRRINLAANVLRGNPVAYRLAVKDGGLVVADRSHSSIVECSFTSDWRRPGKVRTAIEQALASVVEGTTEAVLVALSSPAIKVAGPEGSDDDH